MQVNDQKFLAFFSFLQLLERRPLLKTRENFDVLVSKNKMQLFV